MIPIDENAVPVAQPERRVPLALEAAVEEKLLSELNAGIIEKVFGYSPWQSQIFPVPKKDGSIRICVDKRNVNKAVLKETYPLPTVEQIFGRLGADVKVFSS